MVLLENLGMVLERLSRAGLNTQSQEMIFAEKKKIWEILLRKKAFQLIQKRFR